MYDIPVTLLLISASNYLFCTLIKYWPFTPLGVITTKCPPTFCLGNCISASFEVPLLRESSVYDPLTLILP